MSEDDTAREMSEAANQSLRFADLERKYVELEKDRNTWLNKAKAEQTRTLSLEEEKSNLEQQIVKLRSEFSTANAALLEEKEKGSRALSESKNEQERISRLEAENDNLKEEISELTESKKELRNQLLEEETKAKLNDSAAVPLHYEVDRLKKEIDALGSHNKWLEEDLSNRGQELFKIKTQHSEELMGLRDELHRAVSRRDELSADARTLECQKVELEKKIDNLAQTLKDVRDEAADAAEATDLELQAERKVAYLQEQQLDTISSKNDRLERDIENLRKIANKSAREIESEIDAVKAEIQSEADKVIEEQLASSKKEIDRLKMQLEDSKTALGGISSPSSTQLALISGGTSIGLTDVYSKLTQTEDELNKEKAKRRNLELYQKQLVADISAKTPIMQRQRKEYEEALQRQEEMHTRLRDSLNEAKNCREETLEVRDELNRTQKKIELLRGENVDLAKQVQALLTSKAGGDVSEGVPTTIAEMQKQNQHLLGENHRLSGQVLELQDKIKNDPKTIRLEKMSQELETLREERSRQENSVASIVQQRDLYRALLNNHEGSSDEIANTELLVNSKAARVAESRCLSLEDDLAKVRADLVATEGDRNSLLERVDRCTALNNELTLSNEKLQNELTISNANSARREAEAAFYTEKSLSSTKSLEKCQEEFKKVLGSKEEVQNLNLKLQQQITEGNNRSAKYEHDLRQLEMKLRLSETKIETARSAENRLANESSQLRAELTRQGALLESLQRIEATLTAKSIEEKEGLKEEISRLNELLELERSKQTLGSENTQSRVKELELENKDVLSSKEKALADLVKAKDDLLSATTARQKLETDLVAVKAELSSLKKRLSVGGSKKDASDHHKLDALTQELTEAKGEAISAKERVSNFEKLAKASEDDLAKLLKANEEFKKGKDAEIMQLQERLNDLKDENKKKDEVISEFTRDLSTQRDEQKQAESVLQERISGLQDQLCNSKKDLKAAEDLSAKISSEMTAFKDDASKSKSDYERELDLHANARSELRQAREQLSSEKQMRVTAEEKLEIAVTEMSEKERNLNDERKKVSLSLKEVEESLEQTRKQNDLLHSQIQTLNDNLEKSQSERIEKSTDGTEESGDRKQVSELREIIKFMRSEREMSEAHLDAARRTAEREKAASVVTKRSLDEARAEIKVLQASLKLKDDGDPSSDIGIKLKVAEEQLLLLKESNKLLRVESEKLQLSVTELRTDLSNEKKAMEPVAKKEKELLVEKAGLEAERKSLQRELESWKSRVQSLVSKFNQVDPEEHQQVLKEVENLRKECGLLKSQKDDFEKEGVGAKALVAKLNKDLSSQKTIVQKQQTLLKKMKAEKESAAKTSSATLLVTKERDQLKEMYKKMESEFTSKETELKGANDRIENLKQRLRLFQKTITDQRQKISNLETTVSTTATPASNNQNLTSSTASKGAESTQVGEGLNLKVVKQGEGKEGIKVKSTETNDNSKATKESAKENLPSVPESGFRFGPSSKQTKTTASTTSETNSCEMKIADNKEEAAKEEASSKQELLSRKQIMLAKKEESLKTDPPPKDEPPAKKQKALDSDESAKKESTTKSEQVVIKKVLETDEASKGMDEEKEEKLKAAKEKLQKLRKRKLEMKSAQENAKKKGVKAEVQQSDETKNEIKPITESKDAKVEQHVKKDSAGQVDVKQDSAGQADAKNDSTGQADKAFESRASKEDIQTDDKLKSQFGSGTPFGSGVAFGSGANTFGKSTFGNPASGSGKAFGSSSSSGGFGTSTQAAASAGTSKASSSVFLDMKPPSSTAAPFSFGSSAIKLPTPTVPSSTPAASPFGAFAGNAFGGGATPTARPLFGRSVGVKESALETTEGEGKNKSIGDDAEDKDNPEGDTK